MNFGPEDKKYWADQDFRSNWQEFVCRDKYSEEQNAAFLICNS